MDTALLPQAAQFHMQKSSEGQTGRQRDRQTGREMDKQTAGWQAERLSNRQEDRH